MSARVLVTGVGGMIGSHVARILLERGDQVVGCDSFITGARRNVPAGVDLREVDCRDFDGMRHATRGVAVVVHCAATAYEGLSVFSPHFVTDHNVTGSAAVFSAAVASGARRVVFTSSMARYGRGPVPFHEDLPSSPVDPYGVSKVAAEMLLMSLAELHGIEAVIAVPHNVVGKNQRFDDAYRNVAAIIVNRLLRGEAPIIYGDGEQRRSFTHVEDVAEQLVALTSVAGAAGRVFNLGGDTGFITVNRLAELVCERVGVARRPVHLPPRHGEVRDATCSHERIQTLLGRRFTRTLEDALDGLVADVRALGPRPAIANVPIEIPDARVPAAWLPAPSTARTA